MTTQPTTLSKIVLAVLTLVSAPALAQYDDPRGHSQADDWGRNSLHRGSNYGNSDVSNYRRHNDRYRTDDLVRPALWHEQRSNRNSYDCSNGACRLDQNRGNNDRHDSRDDLQSRFQETSYRRYQPHQLSDPFRGSDNGALDEYLQRRLGKQNPQYRPTPGDYRLRDDYGLGRHLPTRYPTIDYDRDRNGNNDRRYDPLTPPLPRRDGGDDRAALSERITVRYQNPTLVRTVRSLSNNQAFQLYREVSSQTDSRHLEPSAYDLRVRRAMRNLGLALENPVATQALGISADSFRVDGFRDSMARIWDNLNVNNRSDAESVMRTVVQHAQQVPGMTPGMVAFEFANATVDTLDKFSALEPSEPGRGPSAALESEMVGVGIEVKQHDDGLLLMRALRGGPAAEAGLKSGDIITGIDRRRIGGMPMAQSVDLVKGPSGSRITLQIVRNGRQENSVTLTRRRFRVWTVNDVRMVQGTNVGYINLSQFAQTSTQELDQALGQLHRQGMKSLILDVRGNPGGLLTTCVEISNRFLPCGTIVSTKGRLSGDNMHEAATFTRTWETPLVVLVDGDSASASEILAAAIQDNKRGVVVGQKSYGKGTVQTHFPLQSIKGNLRLTTARFYAPSGRPMSGSGVTPDVHINDEDGVANGDRVMNEAIQIAQSRQLKEMAVASGKCRVNQGPQHHNSFNGAMYDAVQPRTVLR